jgi:hypothetical protein
LSLAHPVSSNLKKLNEVEGKEQYRVEVSNRFAVLEDLDAEVEIMVVLLGFLESVLQSKTEEHYLQGQMR